MLLTQLLRKGVEIVSGVYPEREAREMVYAFLEHHIGTKRQTHIVEPSFEVSDEAASVALEAFGRMASGEPLQYVTGFADFYGRRFRVTPDVLIPRPETEILCREALSYGTNRQMLQWPPPTSWAPPPSRGWQNAISAYLATRSETKDTADTFKILDLCTGSGCIAWTLALEMPGSEVTAVDISDAALAVASGQDFAEEIARIGACSPKFLKADVLSPPEMLLCPPELSSCHPERSEGSFAPKYDIIVSNPPYVMDKEKALMRSNVLDHEPHLALFVSDDDPLIFYRAIADWAKALLKPDGFGIVEINEALGKDTADIFVQAGFSDVEVIKDLSDRDRFVRYHR